MTTPLDPRLVDLTFLRLAGRRALARQQYPAVPDLAPEPEGLATLLDAWRRQVTAHTRLGSLRPGGGLAGLLAEARQWLAEEHA